MSTNPPVVRITPYKRTPRPTDPNSIPQYTDNEYRKLEATISTLQAAILQLQAAVPNL